MLSLKDIIALNKSFSTGNLMNESSLQYAVKTTARSKNWLRTAALLTRAILVDHAFEDGNKRTVAAVIIVLMDLNKVSFDPEKVPKIIVRILKNNMTSIMQIERCIKDGIR